MKKLPVKVLSSAALAALVAAPVAPFVTHAAQAATVAEGFYIVNGQNSAFFTLDDLLDNNSAVLNAMNNAGIENVYLVQSGKVVTLYNYIFYKDQGKTFEPGDIPTDVVFKDKDGKAVEVPAPNVAPKVESVSAINLKSFKVNFNKEVDKDTVVASTTAAATDTVRVYDAKGNLVNVTVEVAKDGKSAVVVFNTALSQADSFKVVVDGVKTKDGKSVEKFEQTLTATDVVVPVTEKAEVVNSKRIEITFSEPINPASLASAAANYTARNEFLVDGNPVIASVTPDYANNKLVLNLNTSLSAGEHKLTVKSVKDFAGFPVESKDFTLTVVEDKAAPQITAVKVLNRELVQVTFNELVNDLGTININNSAISGYTLNTTAKSAADLAKGEYFKSADGLTYTFRMASGREFTPSQLVTDLKLDYYNTADVEGNKVTSKTEVLAQVSDDTVAPTATVQLVTADDSKKNLTKNDIVITYSEEMSAAGKITVKDKDGNVIYTATNPSFASSAIFGYNKVVVLKNILGTVDSGEYTVTIEDAFDNGLRQKEMADVTAKVTAVDNKAPTAAAVLTTNAATASATTPDVVTIYFSEAMDKASIENKDNYLYAADGSNYGLLSQNSNVLEVKAADDNKSVTIKFKSDVTATTSAFKVLGVKDASGTVYQNINTPVVVQSASSLTNSNVSFELVKKDEVKVKLTGGRSFSSINPNEIQVLIDTNTPADGDVDTVVAYGTQVVSYNADKTEATIKLNTSLNADGTYGTNKSAVKFAIAKLGVTASGSTAVASAAATDTKDNLGQVISLVNTDGGSADANLVSTLTDKVAPTLTSVKIANETANNPGNAQIVLTFDEDVNYTNTQVEAALVVKDLTATGTPVLTVNDYDVELDNNDNEIVITITKPGVKDHKFSVALANGTIITDEATSANAIASIAETTVKKTDGTDALITERTAPTVSSVTFANGSGSSGSSFDANDTITIAFSEAVSASSLGVSGLTAGGSVSGVSLATIFGASGTIGTFATAPSGTGTVALSADGKTLTVTVTSGTTAPSGTFTLATSVTDVIGNAVTSGTTATPSGSF